MTSGKINQHITTFIRLAARLYKVNEADTLLIMLEAAVDWPELRKLVGKMNVVLAADDATYLSGADEADFGTIFVNLPEATVYEKLNQALLDAIAGDLLSPGADVVAIYSAFEQEDGEIDSLSFFSLDERLGKLSARDLRQLETQVPLETLKFAVDLAVEIGREGREGKPVGTMLVIGDHRKVTENSRTIGFDPVKGYKTAERNLRDPAVREDIKEMAQMDGAFIISSSGVLIAARQLLETGGTGGITLSKGLGTRHWAGAAITKKTKSVAIVVSESNGSVRIFQNGEVMLRIEPGSGPGRRAMTWKELDPTDPTEDDKSDSKKAEKEDDKKN